MPKKRRGKAMRTYIEIGYHAFLLKNESDAAALMKIMSRALHVHHWHDRCGKPIVVDKDQFSFQMGLVRDNVKVVMEDTVGEADPETKKKLKQIGSGQPMLMLGSGG